MQTKQWTPLPIHHVLVQIFPSVMQCFDSATSGEARTYSTYLWENREGVDASAVLEQLLQQLRPLLPLVHEHQLQQNRREQLICMAFRK